MTMSTGSISKKERSCYRVFPPHDEVLTGWILVGVYASMFGLRGVQSVPGWAPYLRMTAGLKLTAQSFTTNPEVLSCSAA
jgi:hypothetical protein